MNTQTLPKPSFFTPTHEAVTVRSEDERLFRAVLTSDTDMIQQSLTSGADVNARGDFQLTPLHAACRIYGMRAEHSSQHPREADQVIQTLLDAGADPTLRDAFGQLAASWCNGYTPANLRERMQDLAAQGTWPAPDPMKHYDEDDTTRADEIRLTRRCNFTPQGKEKQK